MERSGILVSELEHTGGCVGVGVTMPFAGVVVDAVEEVVVDVPKTPTQT